MLIELTNYKFEAMLAGHTSKAIAYQSLISQADYDISKGKKSMNSELIPRSNDLDDVLLLFNNVRSFCR
jgi:hypothetical protein